MQSIIKMWNCTSRELWKDAFMEEKFIKIYSRGRCGYKLSFRKFLR